MPSVWWKICPTLSTWSKWIFIPLRYWRFTYKHQSNRHWRRFSGNYQEISQIQSSKRIWVYFVPWWHTLHSTKVLAFCEIFVEKLLSKFLVLELNLKNNRLLINRINKRWNAIITFIILSEILISPLWGQTRMKLHLNFNSPFTRYLFIC